MEDAISVRMMICVLLPDSEMTGIIYYSTQLYRHLPLQKEFIYIRGKKVSFPYYVKKVLMSRAKIFHIQLEPRFFKVLPENIFMPLIAYIVKKVMKRRLVVTMHAIINPYDVPNLLQDDELLSCLHKLLNYVAYPLYIAINRLTLNLADIVIFHNYTVLNLALRLFKIKPEEARVIPHGTIVDVRGRDIAKEANILCIGFLRSLRITNIFIIIEAFKILQSNFPQAKLHLLLMVPNERYNTNRLKNLLRELDKETQYNEKIKIIINPSEEIIEKCLEDADIGILPHQENTFESSGVAWRLAGLGIPFIGKAIPKLVSDFKFLRNELIRDFSPNSIALALMRLLKDENYYSYVRNLLLNLSRERSWERISEMHLTVYRGLLK
jgi:glycosyltransferase involved in cell wall biosynthesis